MGPLGIFLSDPDSRLEVLELEGCKLSDENTCQLAMALLESMTIRVVNLSKNCISDKSVPKLAQVIETCTSLKGLFLHHNRIFLKGGIQLANALKADKWIEVFDISWNAIGGGPLPAEVDITKRPVRRVEGEAEKLREEAAQAWAEMFKYNQPLLHLDLSHPRQLDLSPDVLAADPKLDHGTRRHEGATAAHRF